MDTVQLLRNVYHKSSQNRLLGCCQWQLAWDKSIYITRQLLVSSVVDIVIVSSLIGDKKSVHAVTFFGQYFWWSYTCVPVGNTARHSQHMCDLHPEHVMWLQPSIFSIGVLHLGQLFLLLGSFIIHSSRRPSTCFPDLNMAQVSPLCHCIWQDVQISAWHAQQVKRLPSVETRYTMPQSAVGQYLTSLEFLLTYSSKALTASFFLSFSLNRFCKSLHTRSSSQSSVAHLSGNSADFSCWITQLLS